MASHNELGKKGEQLAVAYLEDNNYTILEQNYRYLKAEIDIIALQDDQLIVVEVKTRAYDCVLSPEKAVNKKKIDLLVKAINHYVCVRDLDIDVRFDIIAIVLNSSITSINHIEDAFLIF